MGQTILNFKRPVVTYTVGPGLEKQLFCIKLTVFSNKSRYCYKSKHTVFPHTYENHTFEIMLPYIFTLDGFFLASITSAASSQMASRLATGRTQNDQNSKQMHTHDSSVNMIAVQMEPDSIP